MKKLLIVVSAVILAVSIYCVSAQTEDVASVTDDSDVLEIVGLTPEQELEMYEFMARGVNGYWCGPSEGSYGRGELCWYRQNQYFYTTFKPSAFYNGAKKARACNLNLETNGTYCGGYVGINQTSTAPSLYEGSGILFSPKWEASR